MYKWHVHSAIGHGRPGLGEFSKVADGIAASLRQFHVSATTAAESGGDSPPARPSRTQRSATAAAEISALFPGGIDARSLAATPPPSFKIRRVEERSEGMRPPGVSRVSRGGFRGRGPGIRGNSGAFRGRGGRGNRSRGGRDGRGGRVRKRGGSSRESDMKWSPWTPEEQAYADSITMGVPTPAPVSAVDLETLRRDGPGFATLTAPTGLVNTIRDHYRALAGESGNARLSTRAHATNYRDKGATLFVDKEDKATAIGPNRVAQSLEAYDTLDEAEKESILQTLVAGRYRPLAPMMTGKPLTIVDAYAQKNETYLPKDVAAVKAKVQRMLPLQKATMPGARAAQL